MKTNVEKVLERDQKLSELDDRAGKVSPNLKKIIFNNNYFRCVAAGSFAIRTASWKTEAKILAPEFENDDNNGSNRSHHFGDHCG